MSLAVQPTLSELRQSTLSRCGLATEGNIPRAIQNTINERIRSAQLQIYELYPWTINYVTRLITLTNQGTVYDVPDDTDEGHIDYISVRRIQDGYLFQLDRGIRPQEMNTLILNTPTGSMPSRFQFINQTIVIQPPPDTAIYDVLSVNYFQTPSPLIEDGERVVVDGEAVRMLAEILVKEHFGGQDTQSLRASLTEYLDRKKTNQGDGDGLQMGGYMSVTTRPQRRNRFIDSSLRQYGWQDWRPW